MFEGHIWPLVLIYETFIEKKCFFGSSLLLSKKVFINFSSHTIVYKYFRKLFETTR